MPILTTKMANLLEGSSQSIPRSSWFALMSLKGLKRVQVNRLVALQSSKAGQHLVGVVSRITRKVPDISPEEAQPEADEVAELPENNLVRVSLIGILIDKLGLDENVLEELLKLFLKLMRTALR